MTREETKQLIMRIGSLYQNWKPQVELQYVIEAWFEVLEPYSYQQCRTALLSFSATDTKGFAPSPGQLIEIIDRGNRGDELTQDEAFSLVLNAVQRSTYYSREEFNKLPEVVQKAVGSPENLRAAAMDENFNMDVFKSLFFNSYRTAVARSNEMNRLPVNVATMIEEKSEHLEIPDRTEQIKAITAKLEDIEREQSQISIDVTSKLKELREMLGADDK
jgi:hypothetical protein